MQYLDALGRPTVRQQDNGSGLWLQTTEAWDAHNNLIAETDARGNETDYAYDVDGNTIAVGAPAPTQGGLRPTRLFSYDAHDNITAYCDPNATQALGLSWSAPPSAPAPGAGGLCPQNALASQYQWSMPSYEPYGELVAMIAPAPSAGTSGYQRTFSYDPVQQGGLDYGLPTRVLGTAISQPTDPTTPTRTPQQTFWYDGNGNLVCYGTGNGQWLLSYDALGRPITAADPDDSASGTGACGKTGAQAGWNTTARTTYFVDGSVASTQSASQAAAGLATTFTYDLDGNVTTETHHYGCVSVASCTAGVTRKWYDGADRLVEVQQPYDANDIQQYPWSTRYIYDLSQGGVTGYRGIALPGYGNLVKTQELLSGTVWTPLATVGQTYPLSTGAWYDVRAMSFDALDRPAASYEAAFGDQPKLTNSYDGPGNAGLLSSVSLASGELKSYIYDGVGRTTNMVYPTDPNGSVTPGVQLSYDPAGHVTSMSTSTLGTQSIAYDATGAVTSVTEPAALGGGTIGYHYYADGARKDVTYVGAPYPFSTIAQYGYRTDGKRESLQLPNGSRFSWTATAAGRPQTQADPFTGITYAPTATHPVGQNGVGRPVYPASMTFVPRSLSYDSYGRVSALTLPQTFGYSYASSQYDLEDGVAEETRGLFGVSSGTTPTPTGFCVLGNVRNEKLPLAPSPCSRIYGPTIVDLNGTIVLGGPGPSPPGGGSTGGPWTLDARSGMKLNDQFVDAHGVITGSQYQYDASGRMTQDSEGVDIGCPAGYLYASPSMQSPYCYHYGARTKSYDAENRLRTDIYPSIAGGPTQTSYGTSYGDYWVDQTYEYLPPNLTIDYDASSHPTRISEYSPSGGNVYVPSGGGGTTQTLIWLWDGNDRFAQCQLVNGQCSGLTFSLEGLADFDPQSNQTTVYDRNRWGLVVTYHTASGFGSWSEAKRAGGQVFPPVAIGVCSDGDASDPTTCVKLRSGKLTNDGWTIDNDTWQGVRTIDLATGQWNTPDAYAGEVHDPMSQKPFMWNRNNPYSYADPTGFDAGALQEVFNELFADDVRTMADRSVPYAARMAATARLASNFLGPAELKAGAKLSATTVKVLRQAADHGINSLLKSVRSLRAHIQEHLDKIAEAKAAGGFTSSMEREVRDAQNEINEINKLLKELENRLPQTSPGEGEIGGGTERAPQMR